MSYSSTVITSGYKPHLFRQFLGTAAVLCCSVFLVGSKAPTVLETIKAEGTLQVISRNGPTTYYEGTDGLSGFEYTLTKAFADDLGVKLVIREEENLGTLIDTVGTPSGHLGASGLTITRERSKRVLFAEPYLEVTQQLLYRSGSDKPTMVEDLIGKQLVVVANSSHAERLRELQQEHPALRWSELAEAEMIGLVEMVHTGEVDYAIVDSNSYALNRSVYPRARVAFDIAAPQQLAWAFPQQQDQSLYNAAQDFFKRIKADGTLDEITKHYYGHVDDFTDGGALLFARRIETRLPKWKEYLKVAGDMFDLDWHLLAAISYQESHWNDRARSYTGVRGLMMLTKGTAKEMGVSNRVDPVQSIYGGAKYFKKIFDRIPAGIQGQDRTLFALAAYNVGYGHMEDARILTEKQGGNPNKWADVSKTLPLLAKRKHYRQTKHGYARGWEPVAYVQHIRNFYNILAWHGQLNQRRVASLEEHQQTSGFRSVGYSRDFSSSLSLL